MRSGGVEYVWSDALDYELNQHDADCQSWSMMMISDNELRTECFQLLIDRFGHLDTERFIVMMSRSPMDYTTWHQRHFNNGESVRELGEKIKAFAKTRKAGV